MKAYVVTSGAIFGLLVLVHVWRAIEEGPQLATRPEYMIVTGIAAALCFWAWRVFKAI
jgi:hypothetical protein